MPSVSGQVVLEEGGRLVRFLYDSLDSPSSLSVRVRVLLSEVLDTQNINELGILATS